MLRRVVRGESAGGCVFDVVMMMGFDLVMVGGRVAVGSSSGALPRDGPLGLARLDLLSADVDCAAMF